MVTLKVNGVLSSFQGTHTHYVNSQASMLKRLLSTEMKIKTKVFVFIYFFLLSGCATPVSTYLKQYPDTPQTIKDCMQTNRPCIGMNKEQVETTLRIAHNSEKDIADNKETQTFTYFDDPFGLIHVNTYVAYEDKKVIRIENEKQNSERHRTFFIEQYFQKHPDRLKIKELVVNKKIQVGMTAEEVLLSWGKPAHKNRTVSAYSTNEQWIYGLNLRDNYLYFDNGVLTSWQD